VDHLHEHFITPIDVHDGCYWPPLAPGGGSEMHAASVAEYTFPDGAFWVADAAEAAAN